jgi:hypothetical protein
MSILLCAGFQQCEWIKTGVLFSRKENRAVLGGYENVTPTSWSAVLYKITLKNIYHENTKAQRAKVVRELWQRHPFGKLSDRNLFDSSTVEELRTQQSDGWKVCVAIHFCGCYNGNEEYE